MSTTKQRWAQQRFWTIGQLKMMINLIKHIQKTESFPYIYSDLSKAKDLIEVALSSVTTINKYTKHESKLKD